jgi:DnaJ family protein C protein 11
MRDIATKNFQRIREAYEILSNERRRQIYDIYGMEGLTSGLELGPKLKSREEVKAEFERLQQGQKERRLAAHVHQQGSLLMNLSLVQFFKSYKSPNIIGWVSNSFVPYCCCERGDNAKCVHRQLNLERKYTY